MTCCRSTPRPVSGSRIFFCQNVDDFAAIVGEDGDTAHPLMFLQIMWIPFFFFCYSFFFLFFLFFFFHGREADPEGSVTSPDTER